MGKRNNEYTPSNPSEKARKPPQRDVDILYKHLITKDNFQTSKIMNETAAEWLQHFLKVSLWDNVLFAIYKDVRSGCSISGSKAKLQQQMSQSGGASIYVDGLNENV
jgi:hypothetical protein